MKGMAQKWLLAKFDETNASAASKKGGQASLHTDEEGNLLPDPVNPLLERCRSFFSSRPPSHSGMWMLDSPARADRRRFCDRLSVMSDAKSLSSGSHSCEQASLSHRLRPLRPRRDGLRPQAGSTNYCYYLLLPLLLTYHTNNENRPRPHAGRHLRVRARRLRRPRRRAHRAARAAPLVLARGSRARRTRELAPRHVHDTSTTRPTRRTSSSTRASARTGSGCAALH